MKKMVNHVLAPILVGAFLLLGYGNIQAKRQDKAAAADDTDKVYGQSAVDEKAVLDRKSWVASSPSSVGCEERAGSALLRVVLRKTGKVTDVVLRESSGCESFDKRAIKAAVKVKFKPAMKDGSPVSQYVMFQYNFKELQ